MNKIRAIFFSPTGNTAHVVRHVAERLSIKLGIPVETLDLTLPEQREEVQNLGPEDLAVVGTPTYAGRVPNKILPELQRLLKGQDTRAIGIVTFGNRAYDSSLAELLEVLEANGFEPVAGGAMVCSHVFSEEIAPTRPDVGDWAQADAWADAVARRLTDREAEAQRPVFLQALSAARIPVGPYYTPLGTDGLPARFLKAKPVTDLELCVRCGMCVHVCPMGSIPSEDPSTTTGICIKCQACIQLCPHMARHFKDPAFVSHVRMLEENYTRPARAEFFL